LQLSYKWWISFCLVDNVLIVVVILDGIGACYRDRLSLELILGFVSALAQVCPEHGSEVADASGEPKMASYDKIFAADELVIFSSRNCLCLIKLNLIN
jgi:hypothetical protein